VDNYFNYFTEIEEHFQRLWGGILRLSPLDWALIETWKDAGIPLEAVLRGIDRTFENYEKKRPSKTRKVNGLGFCSQEVLAAAEDMKEAAVGVASDAAPAAKPDQTKGLDPDSIAAFLRRNGDLLAGAQLPQRGGIAVQTVATEAAQTLRRLADDVVGGKPAARLEDLERRLTVLEEKLFSALLAATPDEDVVTVRAEADRDLIPYRRKMPAAQIEQLHRQYVHKRLLEKYHLPRLSLFYM
jgi:hypothetical protein